MHIRVRVCTHNGQRGGCACWPWVAPRSRRCRDRRPCAAGWRALFPAPGPRCSPLHVWPAAAAHNRDQSACICVIVLYAPGHWSTATTGRARSIWLYIGDGASWTTRGRGGCIARGDREARSVDSRSIRAFWGSWLVLRDFWVSRLRVSQTNSRFVLFFSRERLKLDFVGGSLVDA